ncbi:hypothetical protein NVV95_14440 [Herbiconiux sp. CPCC 205716]|uniref:DUF7882 domain-containing protein n=1 Tax=Herbiconiux gentiana TaxID=2970912 RepID=A0ABT2GI13_9MICO|nr:hypothetical protein [Herbiconiux gentiana]MCS5715746.1 hypothetical protein [Herbiconiux gentiana]
MGKLYYGSNGHEIEIDDRLLSHLKVVILAKLRRGESFAFSWIVDPEQGSGRGTVWLSPGIDLEFRFYGNRPPLLNRAWISALNSTAERGELTMVPEPGDPAEGLPTPRG